VLSAKVRYLVVVLLAAAMYFALAYYVNGWIWGIAPGLDSFKTSLGRLAGTRVWAHSVHAVALLLAAIPSALFLARFARPHALLGAAITGLVTVVVSLAPIFLNGFVRNLLDATSLVHMGVDSVKFVAILVLLTWLAGKLPSNYAMQRSSRVVTPLAGTASGVHIVDSASGAPTARRR
jgi:hypothetical protein